MDEEEISPELERVLRNALTVTGQLAERAARARADQERTRHAAILDQQRAADQNLARQVEAGRAVYAGVRDPALWEQPNAQRRLGEALVASAALHDVDPLAGPAHQYIRGEARRRHGANADAWLTMAVQMYLDETRELADRDHAQADAQRATERKDPDRAATAHTQATAEHNVGAARATAAEATEQNAASPVPAGDVNQRPLTPITPTGQAEIAERATAAHSFPHPAADDLNRPARRSRPARRPRTQRGPARDRSR